MHPGTPAVITGHAHLLLCNPDDCVMNRWKFIAMHRVFHLMRCVRKYIYGQFISGKENASAFFIGHLRVAHIALVATFLRNQLACHIVLYFVAVNSQLTSALAVCISFRLAKAVPLQFIIVRIHPEHHAKFRHIRKLLHRIVA